MKQDIALPYKKDKKSKKNNFKKFFKKLFKDSPKSKLVKITTYIGLILAVIAFVLALIPAVNDFGLWLAVLAVALGLFGFFKKDGSMPSRVLIVAVIAFVVAVCSITIQNIYNQAQIDHQMYLESGEATEELLDKDISITIGSWSEQGLEVKLKNNNPENKGYGVVIEAKSQDETVVVNEMINSTNIPSGKDVTFTIFKRLTEGQKEALKNAEFKILSVSQF